MLKTDAMREHARVYRVRYDTAQEQLKVWREHVKLAEYQRDTQEHSVKVLAQLLMERSEEFSHQEQTLKRERSRDAKSKRGVLDERAKSLAYVKGAKFDRSGVELPQDQDRDQVMMRAHKGFTRRDVLDQGAEHEGPPRDRRARVERRR